MNYTEEIFNLTQQNHQLIAENALLVSRCDQYNQAYAYLQEQFLNLRRQMFGKKSERFIDPENRQQ